MLSSNSLRQTAHTYCASVHQAAELVAALFRVAGVTAGLVESNSSLPLGLRLTSPASWLPRTGISSGTLRLVIEYGLPWPFFIRDTACIVHDRVYVMVQCLPVCLSHLSTTAEVCGRFAAGRPTGRQHRSIAAQRACSRCPAALRSATSASIVMVTAKGTGWLQTCCECFIILDDFGQMV